MKIQRDTFAIVATETTRVPAGHTAFLDLRADPGNMRADLVVRDPAGAEVVRVPCRVKLLDSVKITRPSD